MAVFNNQFTNSQLALTSHTDCFQCSTGTWGFCVAGARGPSSATSGLGPKSSRVSSLAQSALCARWDLHCLYGGCCLWTGLSSLTCPVSRETAP